jgi:thioredoxin-dependent peroxiredoxin
MLEIGDRLPDFVWEGMLSAFRGKPMILYFYPADLTPGCTMEAKAFNDRYDAFRDAGYEVIGVSVDNEEKHDEFRSECGLRFPLVADDRAKLTKSLDLLKEYGDHGWFARRVTYLLDADGIIQKVWDVEDAGAHPEEVLAAVSAQ